MVKKRFLGWGCSPFCVVFAVFISVVASSGNALAAKYSSIVIDAQSGQVISEYDADSPNYPASLTKMMTLYLTFQALEHHTISLETVLPVSAHAAAQEPTKLNLVAGQSIAVHDLILGLVTQSANDAAVVLAEGLGGTEAAFAEKMTRTARAMGMDSTTFYNASGLPNPFQKTTARDFSKLARHLYLDYPREYAFFGTEAFTYHGVTYGNHNHLMSSFAGMDGIKTGFIHASGFNLAASAVRNNRRLIGVVMGGVSAHARDMKMAELLNAGFDGRPSPDILFASNEAKKAQQSRVTLHMIAHRAVGGLAKLSPISKAEAATSPRNAAHWAIQVGAFRARAMATRAGNTARAHVAAARSKPVVVVMTRSHHGAVYTARITDLSETEAHAACDTLHRQHHDCTVLNPSMQVAGQKAGGATPLSRS
jgi:D-alanyl-D-alanine carboxypeptidase